MSVREVLRSRRSKRRAQAAYPSGRRPGRLRSRARLVTGTLIVGLVLGFSGSGLYAEGLRTRTATATSSVTRVTRAPVKGSRVLVVGDSLTDQSRAWVLAALQSGGWDPVIDAQGGTTIEFWTVRMADLIAYTKPAAVVIELGTNDCNTTCTGIGTAVDQLLSHVSSSVPVFWLNVQEQPTYPADATTVNADLRAATTQHANMSLVDLDARFRNHPEWHIYDGLHFDDAGRQQLGELIAAALQPIRPTATLTSRRVGT